jgi:hypothetical protein
MEKKGTSAPSRAPVMGLCHRCEHRALALESKGEWRPRYQCGDVNRNVIDCYMYRPVKPLILEPADSERRLKLFPGRRGRPRFVGCMFAGREQAAGIADCEIVATPQGPPDGTVLWWWPKGKKNAKSAKR